MNITVKDRGAVFEFNPSFVKASKDLGRTDYDTSVL
jgi:hypothetical protein